jgi:hypothetical protein
MHAVPSANHHDEDEIDLRQVIALLQPDASAPEGCGREAQPRSRTAEGTASVTATGPQTGGARSAGGGWAGFTQWIHKETAQAAPRATATPTGANASITSVGGAASALARSTSGVDPALIMRHGATTPPDQTVGIYDNGSGSANHWGIYTCMPTPPRAAHPGVPTGSFLGADYAALPLAAPHPIPSAYNTPQSRDASSMHLAGLNSTSHSSGTFEGNSSLRREHAVAAAAAAVAGPGSVFNSLTSPTATAKSSPDSDGATPAFHQPRADSAASSASRLGSFRDASGTVSNLSGFLKDAAEFPSPATAARAPHSWTAALPPNAEGLRSGAAPFTPGRYGTTPTATARPPTSTRTTHPPPARPRATAGSRGRLRRSTP